MDIDWARDTKHVRAVTWHDVKWDYLLAIVILSMEHFQQPLKKKKRRRKEKSVIKSIIGLHVFWALHSLLNSVNLLFGFIALLKYKTTRSRLWIPDAEMKSLLFFAVWVLFLYTCISVSLRELPVLAKGLNYASPFDHRWEFKQVDCSRGDNWLIEKLLFESSMTMVAVTRSWM